MINNIAVKEFAEKIVNVYELKPETIEEEHPSEVKIWSKLWEEPEKYVPKDLPIVECDLLLVLGVHSKLGDLIPFIAEKLNAKAVLYPIDDRKMAPEAKKTIHDDLESRKIHVEFPEPFCTLDKSDNEFINEFAKKFGKPKFDIELDENEKVIKEVKVIRDTPGGTATMVGEKLINFHYDDRGAFIRKIYEEHQNEDAENSCLAEMDPICPLMQEAGDLLKDAIFEACNFPTTANVILRKVAEAKGINIKELEGIIVNGAGNWENPEKACDANRTFNLYLEELIEQGKITRRNDELRIAGV
jgi:hypothetical protein